jgi:heptosyltransferase II
MKKVLIVSTNWLGDAVMAMPSVQAFAKKNPELNLSILAKSSVKSIWETHALKLPVYSFKTGYSDMVQAVKDLKKEGFDVVYLLANNFRTAFLVYMAGIPKRVGRVHDNRRLLLTDQIWVNPDLSRHQRYEYGDIFNISRSEIEKETAKLQVNRDVLNGTIFSKELSKNQLNSEECLIGLIPGAKRGPSKQWSPESYIKVGQELAQKGQKICLFGDPSEKELCQTITAAIGPQAYNLAGELSFVQWLAGLKEMDAIVCNDSGGMHVADALEVPLVGIFGITDPSKTGPYAKTSHFMQKSEIRSRAIPEHSPEAVEALKRIKPEEVVGKVLELLTLKDLADTA